MLNKHAVKLLLNIYFYKCKLFFSEFVPVKPLLQKEQSKHRFRKSKMMRLNECCSLTEGSESSETHTAIAVDSGSAPNTHITLALGCITHSSAYHRQLNVFSHINA